ncbi:hypothetical protein CHLRE_02g143287v5 [Chlamydomonas reinhardtii]|uniref:Uncharacterized protein n=1 Tax=Chlamydomonas reinhardtii TaxID=3055 RepID=A0A2K3E4J6_CHLRE|nr:uncharacterized protein CHLRE_02g143287v5 [Chlamydomonas reinhardtii]PNW87714.1 hypothetical protein CHLRE_02g143287v5 [Chlamydomonas reinhardtii]
MGSLRGLCGQVGRNGGRQGAGMSTSLHCTRVRLCKAWGACGAYAGTLAGRKGGRQGAGMSTSLHCTRVRL